MRGKASAERFSLVGDAFVGTPYDVMDCQAFVEACMEQVGISADLSGSNTWYRQMTWAGSPEECNAHFGYIPKGAILYILEHDGNEPERYRGDGIGNASHMGIYTGRGEGAIHSSFTRKCVAYSAFSGRSIPGGWNRIGLWNRFDYGEKINALLDGGAGGESNMNAIVESTNKQGVNLREQKSTNSRLIMKIPEGAGVTVIDDDGAWCAIEYQGTNGYAMRQFLRYVETQEQPAGLPADPVAAEISLNGLSEEIVLVQMDKLTALRVYDALGAALSGGEVGHG